MEDGAKYAVSVSSKVDKTAGTQVGADNEMWRRGVSVNQI